MKDRFYIDSLPYEIELTARVCHENARRLIESCTDKLSIEEFSVLDTIIARPNLSQADLARLILKVKLILDVFNVFRRKRLDRAPC